MRLLVNRKIILFILFVLALGFYDVLLHAIFSVIHIVFEWFELALEECIEHVFHTNRKQTQLIVFYLLFAGGLAILYRIWKLTPKLLSWLKTHYIAIWQKTRIYLSDFWSAQSMIRKCEWLVCFSLSLYMVASLTVM